MRVSFISNQKNDDVYLAHHGIKGQKWGVRKYQNPDGSLTPAGVKRYSEKYAYKELTKHNAKGGNSQKADEAVRMRVTSEQLKKYKALNKKSLNSQLSYDEEDELWDMEESGKTNSKRYKELRKKQDESDEALLQWDNYAKELGKQVLGKYANQNIDYGFLGKQEAEVLVRDALNRLTK